MKKILKMKKTNKKKFHKNHKAKSKLLKPKKKNIIMILTKNFLKKNKLIPIQKK